MCNLFMPLFRANRTLDTNQYYTHNTMFGRTATSVVVPAVQLISKRTNFRVPYHSAPPMRHLSVLQNVGLFVFCAAAILTYPTYVMLNLDNIRPFQQNHFNDELNEALEERRRLRAEGKLNVLQKKL